MIKGVAVAVMVGEADILVGVEVAVIMVVAVGEGAGEISPGRRSQLITRAAIKNTPMRTPASFKLIFVMR